MKKHKPQKKAEKQRNVLIIAAIAIVLVAGLFFAAYYFGISSAGKAYTYSPVPVPKQNDLSINDGDYIVTQEYLPTENKPIAFNFSLNQKNTNQTLINYTGSITWLEEGVYQVKIMRENHADIFDIFEEGSESEFHLNPYDDNESDLKASFIDGQFLFHNQHFISAEKSTLLLTYLNGTGYPLVIPAETGQKLDFRLNASSIITPLLTITIGGEKITNYTQNYTDNQTIIVDFSWTAPSESKAVILKIVSSVKGLITTSNYLLTVGNAAYLLEEIDIPTTTLTFINKSARTAELKVEFAGTIKLQPFALPCDLQDSKVSSLFNNSVKKVYGYNEEEGIIEVWNSGILPELSDIQNIDLFKGYFIELNTVQPYTLTVNCTIPVLTTLQQELSLPPSLTDGESAQTLNKGWNLVSIPGMIPLYLEELQEYSDSGLLLYECANDYKCGKVTENKILYPGKPYWIYASEEQELQYYHQK